MAMANVSVFEVKDTPVATGTRWSCERGGRSVDIRVYSLVFEMLCIQ